MRWFETLFFLCPFLIGCFVSFILSQRSRDILLKVLLGINIFFYGYIIFAKLMFPDLQNFPVPALIVIFFWLFLISFFSFPIVICAFVQICKEILADRLTGSKLIKETVFVVISFILLVNVGRMLTLVSIVNKLLTSNTTNTPEKINQEGSLIENPPKITAEKEL